MNSTDELKKLTSLFPDASPADELKKLTSLFPKSDALFQRTEHVPAALTPEPYKGLLVHDRHMTVMMENFYHSPVVVKVIDRKREGDIYSRKILLERSNEGGVVQFALVRIDLSAFLPVVRDEILSERTPLGRILINHNVSCHIKLRAILKITAGRAFARLCGCPTSQTTYGRLAVIFCDQRPALELLEVAAPIER